MGHSMGDLVIRRYLGDQADAAKGKTPTSGIKRIVMLGPPNQGAELAEKLGDNLAFIAIFGAAGQQLGKHGRSWSRHWPRRLASSALSPAAAATATVTIRC